jgi:hypothetical protein
MNSLTFKTHLAGEYKFVVTHSDGTSEETGWSPNIILNSGLDKLGVLPTGTSYILLYARVGTGTSTPIGTQVQLDAQIAVSASSTTAVSVVNEGAPLYRTLHTLSYAFAQGAVVGNITEVGIGWAATGSTLFSRALIVDNTGSPTTITLVALDQLTVFYRLRVIPPLADYTGSVTIGATVYNYTARVCNVATFATVSYAFSPGALSASGTITQPIATPGYGIGSFPAGTSLAPITGFPSGTNTSNTSGNVSVTPGTYTNGAFFRDDVWSWSITGGNAVGGIQIITLAYLQAGSSNLIFQYRFDTPIPKTNTQVLSLPVRISWARA